MAPPLVICPHTEDGLHERVAVALREQWPPWVPAGTPRSNPFRYGDLLRVYWRSPGDLVIVEGDTVPPPHSIAALLDCPGQWCTHPHWVGDHYARETFGLVKFAATLRRIHPDLADIVAAAPDPRYFVRRGWTTLPRDCSVATLNGPGVRACLRGELQRDCWPADPRRRPTTHDWIGLDVDTAAALKRIGYKPHVHRPPTIHLHDYEAVPVGSRLPWHQRPFDPAEWPE